MRALKDQQRQWIVLEIIASTIELFISLLKRIILKIKKDRMAFFIHFKLLISMKEVSSIYHFSLIEKVLSDISILN